jgi:hypothetical protein
MQVSHPNEGYRGLGGPFRTSTLDRWNGDDPPGARLMAEFEEAGGYSAFTLEYDLTCDTFRGRNGGRFADLPFLWFLRVNVRTNSCGTVTAAVEHLRACGS